MFLSMLIFLFNCDLKNFLVDFGLWRNLLILILRLIWDQWICDLKWFNGFFIGFLINLWSEEFSFDFVLWKAYWLYYWAWNGKWKGFMLCGMRLLWWLLCVLWQLLWILWVLNDMCELWNIVMMMMIMWFVLAGMAPEWGSSPTGRFGVDVHLVWWLL